MEIKEFSKKYNVSIDTLRYYDREKILVPVRVKGRRKYSNEDGTRIKNILKLKAGGFSLKDIKEIYAIEESAEI